MIAPAIKFPIESRLGYTEPRKSGPLVVPGVEIPSPMGMNRKFGYPGINILFAKEVKNLEIFIGNFNPHGRTDKPPVKDRFGKNKNGKYCKKEINERKLYLAQVFKKELGSKRKINRQRQG
mgnify:CR=1 FL=1